MERWESNHSPGAWSGGRASRGSTIAGEEPDAKPASVAATTMATCSTTKMRTENRRDAWWIHDEVIRDEWVIEVIAAWFDPDVPSSCTATLRRRCPIVPSLPRRTASCAGRSSSLARAQPA